LGDRVGAGFVAGVLRARVVPVATGRGVGTAEVGFGVVFGAGVGVGIAVGAGVGFGVGAGVGVGVGVGTGVGFGVGVGAETMIGVGAVLVSGCFWPPWRQPMNE
jgi:hypothetical protein